MTTTRTPSKLNITPLLTKHNLGIFLFKNKAGHYYCIIVIFCQLDELLKVGFGNLVQSTKFSPGIRRDRSAKTAGDERCSSPAAAPVSGPRPPEFSRPTASPEPLAGPEQDQGHHKIARAVEHVKGDPLDPPAQGEGPAPHGQIRQRAQAPEAQPEGPRQHRPPQGDSIRRRAQAARARTSHTYR